jgi:hypothetical protein
LIQKSLGHLAARAVMDADEQDAVFHGSNDWVGYSVKKLLQPIRPDWLVLHPRY